MVMLGGGRSGPAGSGSRYPDGSVWYELSGPGLALSGREEPPR